jgi:hypothetical protein
MTEPSLGLQKTVRGVLVASPAVTALVAPAAIMDRGTRPETFPCVILGDGQTVLEGGSYSRKLVRVYLDLHFWTKGGDLAAVKVLAGAVGTALTGIKPAVEDHDTVDFKVASARHMRDPSGEYGHAVVTVEALLLGRDE